jgi:hypothetical protein
MEMTEKDLQYIIHHIFLPPRLPGESDSGIFHQEDSIILRLVSYVSRTFLEALMSSRDGTTDTGIQAWNIMTKTFENATSIHQRGYLTKGDIVSALRKMEPRGLFLHMVTDTMGI